MNKALLKFTLAICSTLLIVQEASATTCEHVNTGSYNWVECDGVRVSDTFLNSWGTSLSEIQVHGQWAVWKQTRSSGSGTTSTSYRSYWTNRVTGGTPKKFTHESYSSFSSDERVLSLQINDGQAVWRFFDGERNCGLACDSIDAYYYSCMAESAPSIVQITNKAYASFNNADRINDFHMNFGTQTATWNYYDDGISPTTTPMSQYVPRCANPPIETSSVSASVNSNNDITISWSPVDTASYYNREVSINNGNWQNQKTYNHPQSSVVFYDQSPRVYQYRIRACNALGDCSGWQYSNSVSVKPKAPASVSASVSGGNDITISWSAVKGVAQYNREVRINGGSWINQKEYPASQTSVTFYNQQPRTYQYRVRACASTGCSSWKTSNSLTIN